MPSFKIVGNGWLIVVLPLLWIDEPCKQGLVQFSAWKRRNSRGPMPPIAVNVKTNDHVGAPGLLKLQLFLKSTVWLKIWNRSLSNQWPPSCTIFKFRKSNTKTVLLLFEREWQSFGEIWYQETFRRSGIYLDYIRISGNFQEIRTNQDFSAADSAFLGTASDYICCRFIEKQEPEVCRNSISLRNSNQHAGTAA